VPVRVSASPSRPITGTRAGASRLPTKSASISSSTCPTAEGGVRGTARGRLLESAALDKEKVAADIQRELVDRGVADTSVRAEEAG